MNKVTIQDIADALGISRNTVSKAINNSDGLAQATRDRILQKAVEMGYKHFSYVAECTGLPPYGMEAFKKAPQAGGEVAVLSTNNLFRWSNHFAVPMLDKFKRELSQLGYTLNVHTVDRDSVVKCTLPLSFDREKVAGIVCIEIFDHAYARMVCGLGLPVLFVDGPHKRSGESMPADQLYMENTAGITRLVNDMLAQNVRRIGFLGDYEHCQSFFERYTAFRCAMLLAGAPVEERWCLRQNSDFEEAFQALPELPELFLCANDFVACDALQTLRKLGLSVPEDILLAGFDDAPESRIITPALTTIHIHTQVMAYAAASLLLGRIQEPELDYRTMYTETNLIYRDSTNIQLRG